MILTRSQKIVLSILKTKGCMLGTDIPESTRLAPRTVTHALRVLLERGLIKKIPNLKDMRTVYYVFVDSFSEIQSSIQTIAAEVNI